MAMNGYLFVYVQSGGVDQYNLLSGGVTQAGRAGSIHVHSFRHGILSQIDDTWGHVHRRQHTMLSVRADIDEATPWLLTYVGTELLRVELRLYAPLVAQRVSVAEAAILGGSGEYEHFRITLELAQLASLEVMQEDARAASSCHEEVEYRFVYHGVKYQFGGGGANEARWYQQGADEERRRR